MRTLFLLLALSAVTLAAPPKAVPLSVEGNTVMVVKSFPCLVKAPAGKGVWIWSFPDNVKAKPDPENENILIVSSAPNGTHTIRCINVRYDKTKDDLVKDSGEVHLSVGGIPDPTPPVPPDPTPPIPNPTEPFRVLIVYESEDLPKMPLKQQQILFDKKVRDWLNTKCAVDGDRKAWRIWDKDTDPTGDTSHWQGYLKRPRASTPFLHAFRGDKPVHEGPLPDDVEAAMMVLERAEGGK